ncbi:MAG: C25 family cysteine peptidase [Bacteroidota bacterium]|nr:C25 family cysteine peptidase [Bacteroidota bacterium]
MKKLTLFSLVLLFSVAVFGQKQQKKIPLKSAQSSLKVSDIKADGLILESSLSSVVLTEQDTKKGIFSSLMSEGLIKTFDTGNPNIPVISKLIEVPQNATVHFEIVSFDEQIIDLEKHGITSKIMPAQRSVSKSEDPADIPFEYNKKTYSTDKFINKKIAVFEESGTMRATRIGRVELRPIQYNPVKNQLRILNKLVVKVTFKGADMAKTNALKEKYASFYYSNMMQGQLLNFNNSAKELITQTPVEFVIVSDRMFEAQLAPFIAWKQLKGFNVTVGYTDDIGTTTTAIKTWLQALYEGTTPPSFILFVGDVEQIPAWSGSAGSHVTDLRYCEYTGDDLPEVYYGRFSAQTTDQLQPQIDKTLLYEKMEMSDPSYLEQTMLVVGDDSGHEMTWGNGQMWYADNYYFNVENNINNQLYLQPADNGQVSDEIITNMNAGLAFANYSAHCGSNGWGTPSFTTTDVQGLTNSEKYGLWIGNCCLSVKFDEAECFGEAALRQADGGAIGDIGGSNSTYWDEDYWWGVGLTSSIDAEPTYEASGRGSYDGTFHNLANEANDISTWMPTQSQVVVAGNMAVEESASSRKQYYWEIYHLMGDPTITNYIGVPQAMAVTPSPAQLMLGMTSLNVNSAPYSYVALSQNGTLVATALSDVNGDALLEFASEDITVGDADLVVTCQNKIPSIGTIGVSPADEPYVVLNSYTTDVSPDFGNTVSLNVALENVAEVGSGFDAGSVEAVLNITDPYVTINDGTEIYGDIIAGETVTINNAFGITIANNVPDQYNFSFDLTITGTDAKYTWPATLNMTANAPVIEIGDLFVTGDDSNDGTLDPGETGDINFTITNTGHASADFNGLLSESNDPNSYLTLGGTSVTGVTLAPEASQDFLFSGAVAEASTPLGSPVELQLDITAGASGQYTASDNQNIIIGIIPIYYISDEGPYTVCTGTFYDTGGEAGEYGSSEDETLTFLTPDGEDFVVVNFIEFATEGGFDYLHVHDGPGTSSPEVTGSPFDEDNPMTEPFMGANGLTFHFTSDGSVTRAGWTAEVSCYTANEPPVCAENPVPSNGAVDVFPVALTWGTSIGATSYEVYFGTDADPFTNTPETVSSTSYDIAAEPNTTYYWAVLPSNDIGTASDCEVWTFTTGAEQYLMANATVTTCDGVFYDSGGADGNYQSNEDYTMTFLPEESGKMIQAYFVDGAIIEGSTNNPWDKLYAHDGLDISATQFEGSPFSNSDGINIGTLTASNPDGAITFHFTSDYSVTKAGWEADISCVEPNGVHELSSEIKLMPNPNTGNFTIDFGQQDVKENTVEIFTISGQLVHKAVTTDSTLNINMNTAQGIYFVRISNENGIYNSKVIIE